MAGKRAAAGAGRTCVEDIGGDDGFDKGSGLGLREAHDRQARIRVGEAVLQAARLPHALGERGGLGRIHRTGIIAHDGLVQKAVLRRRRARRVAARDLEVEREARGGHVAVAVAEGGEHGEAAVEGEEVDSRGARGVEGWEVLVGPVGGQESDNVWMGGRGRGGECQVVSGGGGRGGGRGRAEVEADD